MKTILQCETLEPRRMLSAGALDTLFGNHGIASVTLDGSPRYVRMLHQPDGKIVVATSVFISKTQTYQFELLRFTSLGKADSSFGRDGTAIIAGAQVLESGPVLTDGGRILESVDGNLMRFTSQGKLDTSFGSHSMVKNAGGSALVLLNDGRILAADGNSLRRYHSDGSVDKSFGNNGAVSLSDPSDEAPTFSNDLDVQPNGKILLTIQTGSGSSTGSIAGGVIAFSSSGKRDRSFGQDGFGNTQPNDENIIPVTTVLTPDGGSVTLMSHEDGGSWLVKLNSSGKLDEPFGEGGIEDVGTFDINDPSNAFGAALLQHSSGKFTALFDLDNGTVAAQFSAEGSLDLGFGGTGKTGITDRTPVDGVLGRNEDLIAATIAYGGDNTLQLFAIQTQPPAKPLVTLSGGVLNVTGTSSDDIIQVDEANNLVTVTINGQDIPFPYKSVKALLLNAGAGDDSISVNSTLPYGATINGNAGNDYLQSINHRSILNGGSGNDTLITYHGGATLIGGAGSDTADFSSYSNDLVITLDNKNNDGPRADLDDVEADIENVIGGSGNDLIIGGPFANHLYGGPGNDTLWGGGGNDTLEGGHGHDQLFGQGGNDLLVARDKTSDVLDGGDGFDRASVDGMDRVANVESLLD